MIFRQHSELKDKHAFLSASKYHWVNYTEEKLLTVYANSMEAQRGTALHAYAHMAIRLGIKQAATAQTLNMYINDCLGYGLSPEQVLFYSDNAFGTADAIDFSQNILRIFDLKNGVTVASETQLEVYAALFCLEYGVRPMAIEYDLRIYQNDEIVRFETDPEDIAYIMDRIVEFDKLIESKKEELS